VVKYDYNQTTGRKTFTRKGSNETVTAYGYDELGRLKTASAMYRNGSPITPQPETTQYAYNEVGSRKSITLPNGVFTEYTYNPLNRLTGLVHYQTSAKTTAISSFSYTLAADGMRKGVDEFLMYPSGSQSPSVQYGYDNLNRLTAEAATESAAASTMSRTFTTLRVIAKAGRFWPLTARWQRHTLMTQPQTDCCTRSRRGR